MPACDLCTTEFPEAPRRGKERIFCSPKCRVAGANARRATTRKGRLGQTNPQPSSPTLNYVPPTVERSPSDLPTPRAKAVTANERISTLMALAHSRAGIGPWEVAELARLRGTSPWAPLSVIIAKETR